MEVILLEKVGKLGTVGDVASVKSGYARNYLFPSGIAIPATKKNRTEFEQRKSELMAVHNEKLAATQARAAKVNGIKITIEVNASDEGKLFGSVGTKEISEALIAAGADVEKSEILLPNGAIREVGAIEVDLDLGLDVEASISLTVAPIAGAAAPLVDTETGEDLVDSDDAQQDYSDNEQQDYSDAAEQDNSEIESEDEAKPE
jgi:large subunit ribosomal protein L9